MKLSRSIAWKRVWTTTVATAILVAALATTLQIPAAKDEIRCWITEAFYDPYVPGVAPSNAAIVEALTETLPVENKCDAADDPAIWVNRREPEKSLVLGTNKLQSINVYGLNGNLLSRYKLSEPNNVDLRETVVDGRSRVFVGVSDKGSNEVVVLELLPETAALVSVLEHALPSHKEVQTYGFCFFLSRRSGHLYAIATDKSGQIEQWRLTHTNAGTVRGEVVRRRRVQTQAEACVADDANSRLFVAEEDVGIWSFGAEPDDFSPAKS